MKNGDIFFSCNENGSFQIWAISPDGNNKRQIRKIAEIADCDLGLF
jgi:hypothetical protein